MPNFTQQEIDTLYCLVDAVLQREQTSPDAERVERLTQLSEKLGKHCSGNPWSGAVGR